MIWIQNLCRSQSRWDLREDQQAIMVLGWRCTECGRYGLKRHLGKWVGCSLAARANFSNRAGGFMAIQQSCSSDQLPEQLQVVMIAEISSDKSCSEILDISRFSSYDKAVRVLTRILNIKNNRTSLACVTSPNHHQEKIWPKRKNFW